MSLLNFSKEVKIVRHSNAVAAGSSVITPSAGVDTQGFRGCCFVAAFGTLTAGAVTSIEVHQSSDDGVADAYGALLGTLVSIADDQDNELLYVEVLNPQKRYLKLVVNRATQNAVLDGIVAFLFNPYIVPVTQPATIAGELHVSPAEGTA